MRSLKSETSRARWPDATGQNLSSHPAPTSGSSGSRFLGNHINSWPEQRIPAAASLFWKAVQIIAGVRCRKQKGVDLSQKAQMVPSKLGAMLKPPAMYLSTIFHQCLGPSNPSSSQGLLHRIDASQKLARPPASPVSPSVRNKSHEFCICQVLNRPVS